MKPFIKRIAVFFSAIIFAFALADIALAAGASSGSRATNTTNSRNTVKWSSTSTMTAAENSSEHWQKHGSEFPEYKTKDAYVAAANVFITTPPKGTLTKKRDNGDTLFYHPPTNTFAVRTKYGVPRTMFKPSGGKNYWDRQ